MGVTSLSLRTQKKKKFTTEQDQFGFIYLLFFLWSETTIVSSRFASLT
jgi:hypothetical protein